MKSGTEFLLAELRELIKRDPPYSENFARRLLMAVRQSISVMELYEGQIDTLKSEVERLDRNMKLGPQRKTERNRAIVHAYKHGATYAELSKKYHMTRQRVYAVIRTAKERGLY